MPELCLDSILRHVEAATSCSRSDLALGDLFEGHRQVVLRARPDQRRRELVERALAELVVVVVDLPRALGGDDHERVARVDLVEQLIDAGMDHGRAMVAAPAELAARRSPPALSAARSRSSFSTHVVELAAAARAAAGRARSAPRSRRSSRSPARAAGARAPRAARRRRSSPRREPAALTASAPSVSSSSSGALPRRAIRSISERSVPERLPT